MRSLPLLSTLLASAAILPNFNNTPTPRTSGQHRTTSNTRLGRSLISPSSASRGVQAARYKHAMITSSDAEIAAHNEKVEQAKKDKIFLKAARLAQERHRFEQAYQNRTKIS